MADGIQLARAAAQAALATDGIYSMGTGRYAEVATYEGSEKVSGVAVRPDEIEVHVVARYPLPKPIPQIANDVRERISLQGGNRKTTVVFEDIEVVQDENL
ncbi:MAG: hypothetical protein WKF44_03530 [Rubrobacteraceae bacterium]